MRAMAYGCVLLAASRQCAQALQVRMREGTGTLCHIVSVDPCRRRVGVACDARVEWRILHPEEQPTPPRKQLRVEEELRATLLGQAPQQPDTRVLTSQGSGPLGAARGPC